MEYPGNENGVDREKHKFRSIKFETPVRLFFFFILILYFALGDNIFELIFKNNK